MRQTFGNGNNRRLFVNGRERHYFLHGTRILMTHPNDDHSAHLCEVDCGGFITATTVKALNEAFENAGLPRVKASRTKGHLYITARSSVDEQWRVKAHLHEGKAIQSFWVPQHEN